MEILSQMMGGMPIIVLECILLMGCLMAALVLAILRKRIPVIVLLVIAALQVFLLHWNTFFSFFILLRGFLTGR